MNDAYIVLILVYMIFIPAFIFTGSVIYLPKSCEIPQEERMEKSDPLNPNNGTTTLQALIDGHCEFSVTQWYKVFIGIS